MLFLRIKQLAINLTALIAIGTAGFCILENWTIANSMYMTVITISTVGYSEMGELSSTGRAFTSLLIVSSIVCMACWTAKVTSVVVEGDITGRFREKKMQKLARKMKNHIVICGSGVFAQSTIDLMYGTENGLVVIDNPSEQTNLIRQKYPDIVVLEKNASDELALAQTNLVKAEYVIVATDSDIDNLLISMTCKQLNHKLYVYSLCSEGKLSSRMSKVGVNEVICPHVLGGGRIAELITKNEKRKNPMPLLCEQLPFIGSGVG